MKKLALIAVAASAATLSMTVASLGYQVVMQPDSTFETYDANKDGVLSFDEVLGAYPTLPKVFFNQADSNDDGVLDESEYAALEGLTAAFDTDQPQRELQ